MKKIVYSILVLCLVLSYQTSSAFAEKLVEWEFLGDSDDFNEMKVSTSNFSGSNHTFENLGPQVRTIYPMRGKSGMTKDGTPLLYLGMQGETAVLVVINLNTGEVYDEKVLEGAKGVWAVDIADDQTVWVGTTPNESLYAYDPNTKHLVNHGKMTDRENTTIWNIAVDDSTNSIFGGTSYGGDVFKYNPSSGVQHLGQAVKGKNSVRSVAIDEKNQILFAGVGSNASLIAWNLNTGSKKEILPQNYRNESFVYDLNVEGGLVFAKLQTSRKMLLFDVETQAFLGEFPALSRGVSKVSPDGKSVYYTSENSIYRFDLATQKSVELESNIRTRSAVSLDFVQLDKPGFPGYTLVGILGNDGLYFQYNLETGKQTLEWLDLPAQPIAIHNVTEGLNGEIISSGFISGNLGIYSPEENVTRYYSQQGQMEGATHLNGKLYVGMYPKGNIFEFDPANQIGGSPNLAFQELPGINLSAYRQERPVAMVGVDSYNKLFIGSYPIAGEKAGALAIFDQATGKTVVRHPFIQNQSVISMVYSKENNRVYGGTTVFSPGSTQAPANSTAVLFSLPANNPNAKPEMIKLPLSSIRMITALTVTDDGRIWGMADGNLIVHNPRSNRTEVVPIVRHTPGFFKNATLRIGKDGNIYGTVNHMLFRVHKDTLAWDIVRNNQDADRLSQDAQGNLYFLNETNMMKANFEKVKNYTISEQDFDIKIPNVTLPSGHRHPIARLFVRTNVDLLKEENGQLIKVGQLEPGHFYRTYGTKGNYYDVGGSHYVFNEPGNISIFVGRSLIHKETPLYTEDGQIHRMLQPGEAVRVYSYDAEKFQVGGGYYVVNDEKIEYFVGYADIKEDVPILNPLNEAVGRATKGTRYRVSSLEPGLMKIGTRDYIRDQRGKVDYAKN
ncbi:WD40 repeat domain-containing protein [Alkalihalobacillus deserti]|uniref:WD40 repeat domain-containing protein n=1 Tax=Alkalihalobacillus deserti TaxID=2879466 RepID=UPI001D153645|nr:WD40 repeat domain-containing protein [Alkalihalobacillus deserti]